MCVHRLGCETERLTETETEMEMEEFPWWRLNSLLWSLETEYSRAVITDQSFQKGGVKF